MRSMISGAKPGPSSLMVTATSSSLQLRRDLDPLAREIDRVLDQIAEAVEDRRIARADRLGARDRAAARHRWRRRNCDAAPPPPRSARTAACGRTARRSADSSVSLARMSRQRCACSRSSRTSSACGAFGGDRALQLLGDHRDGRQRRAELMRGGGGKPVELREMLLARQHQLGRGQRVGELARLPR